MRLEIYIDHQTNEHIFMQLLVNSQRVTGECGITLRVAEITAFMLRLNPDRVDVMRENVSEDLFHRLIGFKNVNFV